jgi:phosphatidylinositol alpha-1,6-mannosyltransferase
MAYSAGRLFHVPLICYLHGIDIIVNSLVYKNLFLPAIRQADMILVNSENTSKLAQNAGINNCPIHVLYPGIILPSPSVLNSDCARFRHMTETENKKILLSVGRLTARKGLIQFITCSLPHIVAQRPDVVFVIIGGEARKALKKSVTTHEDLRKAAHRVSMTDHVRILGHVSDDILAQAYAASDLHVFPVLDLSGDIEGFGTVAVEAASYGLFTAAFASGGVADAVSHNRSGYLIESGNYEQLNHTILEHLKRTDTDRQHAQCTDFAKQFTWERMGKQLRDLCNELLVKGKR